METCNFADQLAHQLNTDETHSRLYMYVVILDRYEILLQHQQLPIFEGFERLFELSDSFSIVKFCTIITASWFKTAFSVTFVTVVKVSYGILSECDKFIS